LGHLMAPSFTPTSTAACIMLEVGAPLIRVAVGQDSGTAPFGYRVTPRSPISYWSRLTTAMAAVSVLRIRGPSETR